MVDISKSIDDQDFEFTNYDDNHYELISNFGSIEYHCTGICYCSGDNYSDFPTRKAVGSSPGITIHRLVYLLVAVSSLVAYDLTSEYFDDECVEKMSLSSCPLDSIRSEVEDCNQITLMSRSDEEVNNEDNIVETNNPINSESKKIGFLKQEGQQQQQPTKWWCKGSCVVNPDKDEFEAFVKCQDHPGQCMREAVVAMGMNRFGIPPPFSSRKVEELWETVQEFCSSLTQEGEVEINNIIFSADDDDPEIQSPPHPSPLMSGEGVNNNNVEESESRFSQHLNVAKEKFRNSVLVPGCIEVMKYQVEKQILDALKTQHDIQMFQTFLKGDPRKWSICVGEYPKLSSNPTIECRPVK